jgi:outer membrane protein OmpA-like peptidoglycan-associated protein
MGNGNDRQTGTETHATHNRMTGARHRLTGYRPERNVPGGGGIEELRPGRQLQMQFHIIGFDINSAVLTPNMKQQLDKVIQHLKLVDDVDYRVVVTGTASESRIQRIDPVALGQARAEAIGVYLLQNGIPGKAILKFSHGSVDAPAATASPEVKAEWRGAFIDIQFSGRSWRPPPKPIIPPRLPDPNKDPSNVKILIPPTKYKDIPKKVKEIAEFIRKLNQSASDRTFHNHFEKGWAHGLALLTEGDPEARSLESFKHLPQVDLAKLTTMRLQARTHREETSWRLDEVEAAGKRFAYEQISALGPDDYYKYAAAVRRCYPKLHAREIYYRQQAMRDEWHLTIPTKC